ncbi:MAG: HD domain-containing protein, partial [Actinobacteria bacterium]|nr:HD domain-containing protein [Actinomycetota bacterium]
LNGVAEEISIGIKSLRNEKKILDGKKEYEELFKRVNSCIAIYEVKDNGNDFIFKDFNKAAERADKIKREDIIGKSVLKVFPGVKDFGLFDVFKKVYKTAKPENHPISLYKDKRISGWRENYVYKLPSGDVIAVYNDLTEKKKYEERIRNLARLPLENPYPVGRIDYHGKVVYCNFACNKKLKKKDISQCKSLCLPPLKTIKKITSKKIYKTEFFESKIDDRIFSFSLVPIKGEDYINFYGRDITEIKEGYKKLKDAHEGILIILSSIVEIRDPYTSGHQKRVAQIATCISNEMGFDSDKIETINTAALIHDTGKIIIPPSILARPGTLSEIEFSMVKTHPRVGYDFLINANLSGNIPEIILQHHEREDGSGYPSGLKADSILLEAKILAVADVVEAMSSHRPYRPALGTSAALEEIKKGSGKIYNDKVVKICLKIFEEGKIKLEQI